MHRLIYLSLLIVLIASCGKEPPKPAPSPVEMSYIDLQDTVIRFHNSAKFDMNGDGAWDVFFDTELVGDPIYKVDKMQWLIGSAFYANLPVNSNESIPVLQMEHQIPVKDFSGYSWYNASTICLTQKIIGYDDAYWDGDWKTASHNFIPIQVLKNEARYNGWIEVSFDASQEILILHKAAISKEAGRDVIAGK